MGWTWIGSSTFISKVKCLHQESGCHHVDGCKSMHEHFWICRASVTTKQKIKKSNQNSLYPLSSNSYPFFLNFIIKSNQIPLIHVSFLNHRSYLVFFFFSLSLSNFGNLLWTLAWILSCKFLLLIVQLLKNQLFYVVKWTMSEVFTYSLRNQRCRNRRSQSWTLCWGISVKRSKFFGGTLYLWRPSSRMLGLA